MLYLKKEILLMSVRFHILLKTRTKDYNLRTRWNYSFPCFTWKAGLKLTEHTDEKVDFKNDKQRILLSKTTTTDNFNADGYAESYTKKSQNTEEKITEDRDTF